MKKLATSIIIIFFSFFISCKKSANTNFKKIIEPQMKLEKIIIVNLNEVSITFFKIRLKNDNESNIIFQDNNLSEFRKKRLKPNKTGFYLKNTKNDSLIMLGIDSYYFYEIIGKKSEYFYVGTSNLRNSFNEKDSLKLRKLFSNFVLEYDGKMLNLDEIKKSSYISQTYYDDFIKRKNKLIPINEKLTISIPSEVIEIKYIKELPITKNKWDSL